jgi:antitoxin component of RelBE/YafQ-DinJ toxin-antitoxin module
MAQMTVPDEVKQKAAELATDKDMTMKEAIRLMVREGGYDV